MKKILLLLLFTVASYGQAVFDEGIQITNTESTTATKVNVQEANGKVNTQTIKTGFNKNIGLGGSDVVGASTLLNQYATTPSDWTAQSYVLNSVVFYAGKQWIAKIATVAGDVPSVSSKWEEITFEALSNKTTTVDQTIIDSSTNAVSSNAVFDGLALKSNIGHTHVASQITDLSKASVGLGNVDNTSDLSKPLSTATINALATKAPISSVHNPVTIGTANGLSLATQQLSLGLASSSTTGALSGTDWNTFNEKFNTPTGLTTNYLPKWNGSGFGNSQIFDNGTNIGIGTILPSSKFEVNSGDIKMSQVIGLPNTAGYGLTFRNVFNSNIYDAQIVCRTNAGGAATSGLLFRTGYFNGSIATQADRMYIDAETGNVIIGTTTDNLVSKLQVNGTISASPATTANQVVVKSQLDAVATGASYTPTLTANGNITSLALVSATYARSGNIITCQIIATGSLTASPAITSYKATLPFNKVSGLKVVGVSSLIDTSSVPTASGIGIVQANSTTAIFNVNYGGGATGSGRTFIMNFQYDVTQ